jgi:hypothetical protein
MRPGNCGLHLRLPRHPDFPKQAAAARVNARPGRCGDIHIKHSAAFDSMCHRSAIEQPAIERQAIEHATEQTSAKQAAQVSSSAAAKDTTEQAAKRPKPSSE